MNCILDACAMIALLRREPGQAIVWAQLSDPTAACYAHTINLWEVYDFFRAADEPTVRSVIQDLKALGIIERNDLDEAFWRDAMWLKALYRNVSLADCFAISLTKRLGGTLLTSDHDEFHPLAALNICP